ncbi:hypothetical protein ThesuDRAFT_01772 [Thermaerobacter subterraneus DSM 13965]|uniref:SPOR domain-containing protein n=1 Tax=Thermaerobacter subterraneus DSM 13965 TaxID=867903 RepID=K6PZ70_9FIRM|nr:hypothetical protein ThesuDRAFT_01772 [Thermaerobacter subterraneus DSM 13965]
MCRYFGKTFKDPDAPALEKPGEEPGTATKGVIYRARMGAFKAKNAKTLEEKARKAGFEVWIHEVNVEQGRRLL